jgi:hypothetical protein
MKLGKILLGVGLIGVNGAAFGFPSYIDTSGREWLDLNETRMQTWNDVAGVCSAIDGTCSGSLQFSYFNPSLTPTAPGLDLTGFIWADRDQVRELFYDIAGLPAGSLDSYSASFSRSLGFGDQALAQMDHTIGFDSDRILNGFTRSVAFLPDGGAVSYLGTITGPGDHPVLGQFGDDSFQIVSGYGLDTREPSIGAYLYRASPTAVPEPGMLALAGTGLIALFVGRRRRRAER